MNPREFEILNLISKRNAAERPVPAAVELALKPGAPAIPEMIATAFETASQEVQSRVRAYCAQDPEYAALLATYEGFARQEEVKESPVQGSILAEMTVAAFGLNRTDQPQPKRGPTTPSPVAGNLTPLLHDPNRWPKLLSSLRTWFPAFIKYVGLPADSSNDLLTWVENQFPTIGTERFRTAFPRWVRAFAQARGLSDELPELPNEVTREWFTVLSFKQILEEGDEYELPEQKSFRVKASHERFPTVEEFERYTPDQESLPPDVVDYRRELAVQTRDRVALTWAAIEQN